jgi:hypothetical protein
MAPARGAPLHPQVGTKERPPGTNKGTAQSQETIDDVINTLTRRVLREDETTMEDRSSRRLRTLVTRKARRGLSANEIACALISMMARSTTRSNATHGRTIHPGQNRKSSMRANVFRFAPESGHCATQSACLKSAMNGSHKPIQSPRQRGREGMRGLPGRAISPS